MRLLSVFLSSMLLILQSCTKTEDLAPLPEDKILEYKVTNLADDQVIYGAIDHQKNSITVYIPFYYGLTIIDPEIKVSNGAELTEEILPVPTEGAEKTYTVKAKNGTTRTYTLAIVLQSIPNFSASWASTEDMSHSPGDAMLTIRGNFGHTNANMVKVTFIHNTTQQRAPMNMGSASLSGGGIYDLRFGGTEYIYRIPADLTEGSYTVEVQNLGHTVLLPEPILISYKQPQVYLAKSEIPLTKTGEWEIIPLSTVFLGLKKVTATIGGIAYELPIKSWSRTGMKVTLPANFPTGVHNTVDMKFDFEGWQSVSLQAWINVSAT